MQKLDLINSGKRIISSEKTDSLKEYLQACGYSETSAKLGTGVNGIFQKLTVEMHKLFD